MYKALFILIILSTTPAFGQKPPFSLENLSYLRQVQSSLISPIGTTIAFTLNKPVHAYDGYATLSWRDLYLSNQRGVISAIPDVPSSIGRLAWSADGKHLWFLGKNDDDEHIRLFRYSIKTEQLDIIIEHQSDILGFSLNEEQEEVLFWAKPAIKSRDKALLNRGFVSEVYEESVPRNQLWRYSLSGAFTPQKINLGGQHVLEAQYIPDSKNILLQSSPSALVDDVTMRKSLSIIDKKGVTTHQFTHTGKMKKFAVSPSGQHVAIIGTNDIHDPAQGRLLVAPIDKQVFVDYLPSFMGHVKDIGWLSSHRIGLVAHKNTSAFFASKRIDTAPDKYKVLVDDIGIITRFSNSKNGSKVALIAHSATHPKELFWYSNKQAIRLTTSNAWLKKKYLPTQEVISYKARDGLSLEGVLVLPQNHSESPVPLILFIHGGPEAHVSNGWLNRYSHPVAYAASRGFASFFPNYRGSTGRGVTFTKLGQGDYAGAEFNDIIDAKQHLVDSGLVDANRVGITGSSYGGYASAWAATKLTEHFAASVATMGIADQTSKFGTTDIPTEMVLQHARAWPWDNWRWMLNVSPIRYAGQSKTPLLLLHGKNDTRVHYSQSMQLYRHFKQRTNTPVRLVLYPNEGHGFMHGSSRLDYSMRLMRWMEHFLQNQQTTLPPYILPHVQFDQEEYVDSKD